MRSRFLSILKYLIGWPFSFLAIFFIVKSFAPQLENIKSNLEHMNVLSLVIAFVCFLAYYFVRSYDWKKLLQAEGHDISLRETTFPWASSEFKRYIPGNVLSFVSRAVLFSEKGMTKKDVGRLLFIEAQLILLGSFIVSLLSLPFLLEFVFPNLPFEQLLRTGIIVLVALGSFLYIQSSLLLSLLPHRLATTLKPLLPKYGITTNAKLLFLSILSFIFFGLGYYFAISSLLFLHPQRIFEFIGFFVFSLIVGLLSFITPTGLGVREGAITVGLSKVTTFGLAGFASIFARIVLVTSEVIFLLLSFLWQKATHGPIYRVEKWIGNHVYASLLWLGIGSYSLYFSIVSMLRFDNYYTGRFDLGNMTQTVWNTAHGNFFRLTDPNGTEQVSRLAFHADFLLVLFAPFYWIWESPKVLLIAQAVIVALGAIFVFKIAQKILRNDLAAFIFAVLYLLNPSVERATLYDFHAVVPVTTFLLGTWYFLERKRYWWFVLFAMLAGITKEQIWAIIALMGLYIAFIQKRFAIGLTVFFIGAGVFYFLIWQAIPMASAGKHFALSYYNESYESPTNLIKGVLFHPSQTITTLADPERLLYLNQLLLPLGFVSLTSPLYLIFAAPDLGINMLSNKPELHQIYYQYTAAITPFLFIAAMYGVRLLRKYVPANIVYTYVLLLGLYGVYLYGPLPGLKRPNIDMLVRPQEHKNIIDRQIALIPKDASVIATNNIGSHLSHRKNIYTFPIGIEKAEYIVAFTKRTKSEQDRLYAQTIENLAQSGNYMIVYNDGSFVVLQKKPQH